MKNKFKGEKNMITSESKINTSEVKNESILVRPIVDSSLGLLVLRLALGAVFFAHGGQKVFGWFGGFGLEGTIGFMTGMGIPAVLAYIAIFTEFFGGLAILAGLLTRPAALGLAITMLVAIFKVHIGAGFFAPNGYEFPLALAAIAISLLISGPGKYSLDAKLTGRK
jgi:putative oxidoreductase